MQAAYFILIARSLGPNSYGAFVAVTAVTNILNPFVGLGSSNLFIKNLRTEKRSANVCWGNGLILTIASGAVCTLLVLLFNLAINLGLHPADLSAICICDLILIRITDLAGSGFTACDRMIDTSIQNVLTSLYRLVGIATLSVVVKNVTLQQWTHVYLLTGIIGAAYAIYKSHQCWGRPLFDWAALREDAVEGVYFSVGTSAQSIYNDIDKTMLAKLSDFASTGIYGAAYRIIDTTMSPIRALLSAAYPRFFKVGTEGLGATYAYALTLIKRSALYGAMMFVILFVLAPALPLVLGSKYQSVVPAVRGLAIIPLLRCVHLFLADALSGANLQNLRTLLQVLIAVLNIGLNFAILRRWSWQGAVATSVACDALLVAVLWYTIVRINRIGTAPALKDWEAVAERSHV